MSGAAFAATCIAAVAATGGAAQAAAPTPPSGGQATAEAPVSPSPTSATPEPEASSEPSGPEGSSTPSQTPGSPGTSAPDTDTDSVTTARAVMVTPAPPRTATYAYGSAPRQRLDAYWRPSTSSARQTGKRPGVLLLHGGYWLEGDKSDWKYFARRLTNEGFAVFAANYRLAGSAAWPAQRDDAEAALDYVKRNAARWNVDPDRIAVVGSSAGGMLATQLGTYGQGAQRVRGVVALSPVNTPYLAYQVGAGQTASSRQRKLRRAVVTLLGCRPVSGSATCWTKVDDATSATHASAGDAPMLLMHADGDFVPRTQSTGLAGVLNRAGVPATVVTVPGGMHGLGLMQDSSVYPRILSFLKARTR
ncbi:alpha/beta fold hydrolase [Actinomadura sp. NBRC 104425]|uniref:alpha/beta fold hydrolase n=1 Tax=Actinomadura sp. NBRC 104425 TaxID=3032204 RepID=UPI0025558D73|nr:alpha/beta fold hydrolase [Actinomadura sp. NBRC 104425]